MIVLYDTPQRVTMTSDQKKIDFIIVFVGPRVGGEILNECRNGYFRCLRVCIWSLWTTVCDGMSRGHIQHI